MKSVHVCLAAALLLLSFGGGGARSAGGGTAMKEALGGKRLSLRGRVAEVKVARENGHGIVLATKLDLEFTNVSDEPVILLQREFWLGAKNLARSPEDAAAHRYLYTSGHWPAASTSPEWAELRQRLDRPHPPQELTRVLAPHESLPYEVSAALYVEKAGSFDGTSQRWDAIRQTSPIWLQVTLEVWPVNVEPRVEASDRGFGLMLQRRWERYGALQIEQVTSEPMRLDLSALTPSGAAR